MKTKLIAIALLTATAGTVALYPAYQSIGAVAPTQVTPPAKVAQQQRQRIEVVFVLDTTGSMGGMIEAAKEKIWSIASSMASAQTAPDIHIGLVAYRDRGDAYVTRVLDLSSDLDSIYAALMEFRASGGGDGPESVNQALHEAVNQISWSTDDQTYRSVFLVGDAPPHMDYIDDVKFPKTLQMAEKKGIVINTIQCGESRATLRTWQQIAQLGGGGYFQVQQNGGALAIATPYDEQIAKLSKQLDRTRLYYGTPEERMKQQKKMQAAEKLHAGASVTSRARRATFNASKSGEKNFLGEGELVDDVASGKVDIDSLDKSQLPAPLATLEKDEQQALIKQRAEERHELQTQINRLAEQRADYIKEEVATRYDAESSLDQKIYDTVKRQAESKGLHYEAAAPAY